MTLTKMISARLDRARLVEACQYLRDASMGDEQLTRDITRSNAEQGQLDDSMADMQRQGSSIDEHPAQLIDSRLTCVRHNLDVRID